MDWSTGTPTGSFILGNAQFGGGWCGIGNRAFVDKRFAEGLLPLCEVVSLDSDV